MTEKAAEDGRGPCHLRADKEQALAMRAAWRLSVTQGRGRGDDEPALPVWQPRAHCAYKAGDSRAVPGSLCALPSELDLEASGPAQACHMPGSSG